MDSTAIEREIRRLSPWYYVWDLGGVRTDITPTCLPEGHQRFTFPAIYDGFWRGKTVLDAACNEGFWSFGAIQAGAAHVDAFDCRDINIERARLVQKIQGHTGVDFHVATCESWLADHPDQTWDLIMLNGLLYHLEDPAGVIRDYCARARDWVYVASCLLHGGEDGYTWIREPDNMAASHESRDSLMPNTTNTLIAEFARHGFVPVHVEEQPGSFEGGGCSLMLRNTNRFAHCRSGAPTGTRTGDIGIHLAPHDVRDPAGREQPFDFFVAIYNATAGHERLTGRVVVRSGGRVLGTSSSEVLELTPRPTAKDHPPSASHDQLAQVDLAGARGEATVEVVLRAAGSDSVVAARALHVDLG